MRSLHGLVIAGLFTISIGAAHAQMAPSTPVPAPKKPPLAAMSFLVGTWSCSLKSSRRPVPIKSIVTYALDADGYWLVGKGTSPGASWFPRRTTSTDMYTYDLGAKRWVHVFTDSVGNYDLETSKGFIGGTIVWHSLGFTPTASSASVADTMFRKISATKTLETDSFVTGKGKKVTVTIGCTKT